MGRNKDPNRKYHDRVASRYDSIYDDAYWEFHDRITWHHLKTFVPKDLSAAVMDLGTGTGKWGLKLLKAGFATTFVDLSNNMLQEVRKKLEAWSEQPDLAAKAAKGTVQQADAVDLRAFGENQFDLIMAMGDVVSICSDPPKCLTEVHRILKPGAAFVFTVDNHLAALEHFLESGNLRAMGDFVRSGKTEWLTKNVNERFDVHMYTPAQARAMVKSRGFEIVSEIGKTIIPARRNRKLFEEDDAVEKLVEMELILGRDPSAWARASHLQFGVRKA